MPSMLNPGPAIVLVVDDDALTCIAAVMMVESAGYVAIAADDADGAMRALRNNPQVAALFSDIHMPGVMDGLALAHEGRRLRPLLGILLVSGDARPTAAEMPDHGQFLHKPYSPAQIALALGELIAPNHGQPGASRDEPCRA